MTQPDWTIKGGPAIKSYAVLNDKRHVLTRDTEENVALWDILKVNSKKKIGKVVNISCVLSILKIERKAVYVRLCLYVCVYVCVFGHHIALILHHVL